MRLELSSEYPIIAFEEVDSTQTYVSDAIRRGDRIGGCIAGSQTAGRGRFRRIWYSPANESLSVSIAFWAYADHPKPYLVGMACAVAMARAIGARVRWPNDVIMSGTKVGGILTDMVPALDGRVIPVVGIGVNIGQVAFPLEIQHRATSLALEGSTLKSPKEVLAKFQEELANLPEPTQWSDLQPLWALRDDTPGKLFRLPTGQISIAIEVTESGNLRCDAQEKEVVVQVAEAIFG